METSPHPTPFSDALSSTSFIVCVEMCRVRAISLLDMFFALSSMMSFALRCFAMVNLPFSIWLAMPVEYKKRGSA